MSPMEMLIRISQVSGAESSCKEVRKKMVFYRIKTCETFVVLKNQRLSFSPNQNSCWPKSEVWSKAEIDDF